MIWHKGETYSVTYYYIEGNFSLTNCGTDVLSWAEKAGLSGLARLFEGVASYTTRLGLKENGRSKVTSGKRTYSSTRMRV